MAPVSRLGLGTATLGNLHRRMCGERARAVLATAWTCGVRHFDTAPHYGLGLAERRLGSFLHGRQGFTVSTKVGRLLRPDPDWAGGLDPEGFAVPAAMRRAWDVSAEGLRRSLEESLARTGLDRVDVAYVHDPERSGSDLTPDQVVTGLVRLRDEGLVGEVGVASMSTRALANYTATGALDVVMVAGRHTLLDQSAAAEVFPHCRRHGTRRGRRRGVQLRPAQRPVAGRHVAVRLRTGLRGAAGAHPSDRGGVPRGGCSRRDGRAAVPAAGSAGQPRRRRRRRAGSRARRRRRGGRAGAGLAVGPARGRRGCSG